MSVVAIASFLFFFIFFLKIVKNFNVFGRIKSLFENGNYKQVNSLGLPLIRASQKGYLENPLTKACEERNLERIKSIIENGNYNVESLGLPLIFSSEYGHLEVVEYLISIGADKEAKDNFCGCTPLIWATENGHLEVVKYLISVGADKEAKNKRNVLHSFMHQWMVILKLLNILSQLEPIKKQKIKMVR
ncbi:hypothetical protein TVAG_001430, partial [Trichomonas vaginalis G3]